MEDAEYTSSEDHEWFNDSSESSDKEDSDETCNDFEDDMEIEEADDIVDDVADDFEYHVEGMQTISIMIIIR